MLKQIGLILVFGCLIEVSIGRVSRRTNYYPYPVLRDVDAYLPDQNRNQPNPPPGHYEPPPPPLPPPNPPPGPYYPDVPAYPPNPPPPDIIVDYDEFTTYGSHIE